VDANAVSAQVISVYLANWQLDATIVSNVDEAETAWHAATSTGQSFDVAILDIKGLGARAIEFAKSARAEVKPRRTELILLVGLDSFVSDNSLNALDAAAILPKPVRPSDLFNALVSIASDGSQRKLVPHFLRRKAQAERPNFAARILIAEDNPVNQEVASGMLETMGCRFVTAPNGRVAFRLFAEEKFDLVLMDCEMPIMDGIESTRRIREIETMAQGLSEDGKPRQRTPIIALTAHAINEVRDRCINAGMDDFLVKPFDDRQLATTLRRWLVPQGMMDAQADAEIRLPPAAADSHPDAVIDATIIAVIRKGGAARLGRAVSRFLEVAPTLATTIRDSCEEGDAEALWRAAHSLKSSAGALGATQLSQRCGEIESTTRNAGVDAAKPLVTAFDEDLTAAVRGLQALIGETYVPA
jgi:CheY-like chemotaxis protein/HPt (histidine-containing phosphotransfer) domain-containing protein